MESPTSPMECWIGRGYLNIYGTYVALNLFPNACEHIRSQSYGLNMEMSHKEMTQ